MEEEHNEEKDEFMFNEITGCRGKKSVTSMLNKSKLSRFEMDQIFCEE